jgi:REP element-mobilizing transposase RayT
MPRRKRSYLPGCAFHITARTHCGEFWFEELRSEIVQIVAAALKQTDTLLLAYAIMTNHIHLVVRQGAASLAQLMHPVCQRTAYAVHRTLKRQGYVMGYRYFDSPCRDEAHLRNAIIYTHRNPVEAGMCVAACDYEWSSEAAYRTASPADGRIAALRPAVEVFASGLRDRTAQQDYADYYAWYDACKKLGPGDPPPHSPGVTAGDEYWLNNFSVRPVPLIVPRNDLRDIVRRALTEVAPVVTLDELRAGSRSSQVVAARNAVIDRALRAGHRPVSIARFLNTSDTTVSRVRAASGKLPEPGPRMAEPAKTGERGGGPLTP